MCKKFTNLNFSKITVNFIVNVSDESKGRRFQVSELFNLIISLD